MLHGPDKEFDKQQLISYVQILAATWNRRYAARNCIGHDWEDRIIDSYVGRVPAGTVMSYCRNCGVEKHEWELQELEELMSETL